MNEIVGHYLPIEGRNKSLINNCQKVMIIMTLKFHISNSIAF